MDIPAVLPAAHRSTWVLVHGSWCTGEAWNGVAHRLRADGHTVHTPTIAGHGADADRTLTHADQVQSVIDYITERRLTDFVLVGHSMAGSIVSQVAAAMPDRIRRVVFQNAFVVRDGCSIMDEVPLPLRTTIRRGARDGAFLPPFGLWRDMFIQDADYALAQSTYRTLSPEPMSTYEDRLDQRAFYGLVSSGRLPCSYLNVTDDNSLPGGWIGLAERLGAYRLVQMPGSHEVMLTDPFGLARKIIEAGRD